MIKDFLFPRSTEKSNYSLPIVDEQYPNGSRENFPLPNFDMNNFFSNWSLDDVASSTEYENFTAELNYTENLDVRNSIREVDENAILIEQDSYPHANYDDYGFPDNDYNSTFDFYEESTESTTFRALDKAYSHTTPNLCGELGKIIRCYERICENKTFTSDNFSGRVKVHRRDFQKLTIKDF